MAGSDHYDLGRRPLHFNLDAGGIAGRKQRAARERKRGNAEAEPELSVHIVSEARAGRAHGVTGMLAKESPFFGGCWLTAGCASEDGAVAPDLAERGPQFPQRLRDLTWFAAVAAIGDHAGGGRDRLGAARGGMRLGLEDEEGADRADRKTLIAFSFPHRRELAA